MPTERRPLSEPIDPVSDAPFDRPPVEPPALVLAAPVFWEKYKSLVLAALALVLLGLIGSAVYGSMNERKLVAASGALGAARTPEDLQKVIADYPDTPAGEDAWLLLARAQRERGDAKTAETTLRTFVDKHPKSPLAGGALLALAGELQARGDREGALGLFQQGADRYPKSYSAPLALFSKGELQRVSGKPDDAKRTYENLLAAYPKSIAAQQAQGALRFLRAPVTASPVPNAAPPVASSPVIPVAAPPPVAAPTAPAVDNVIVPTAPPAAAPTPTASP